MLRVIVAGVHATATLALWLAQLPVAIQASGTIALILSLWHYSRLRALVTLRCHKDGRLERQGINGWSLLYLTGALVLLPWLVVVRCTQTNNSNSRSVYLILAPDALHMDDFRHLRVWLRWRNQPVPTGQIYA